MKKFIWCFLGILLFTGCSMNLTPTKKTEEFLTKYQSLDDAVISDLDYNADTENLGSTNKGTYKDAIMRVYQNLKYEITNETVEGDEAVVTAKVTVYDLYKAREEAADYRDLNIDEFQENGVFNQNSYREYELDKMLKTNDTVDYTIDFYLEKIDDEWKMKELSTTTKEKLHGIYDYENE